MGSRRGAPTTIRSDPRASQYYSPLHKVELHTTPSPVQQTLSVRSSHSSHIQSNHQHVVGHSVVVCSADACATRAIPVLTLSLSRRAHTFRAQPHTHDILHTPH